MIPIARAIVSAAAGAVAMYWLDPTTGRRRRAYVRERLGSVSHKLRDGAGVAGRDLSYRAQGIRARIHSAFTAEDVSDEVLEQRVRAALGRAVSHPRAVEVTAADAQVRLTGDVLAYEHSALLRTVRSVRGVNAVIDALRVHDDADGIPALQGGQTPNRSSLSLLTDTWPPATRMLSSASAGALLLFGASELFGRHKRNVLGVAAVAIGGLLLGRSAVNVPFRQLAGRPRDRGITTRKAILVDAPVEHVFNALTKFENFPTFMRNVQEVRKNADGSWHWTVAGPAGVPVEWDAHTTAYEPNQKLAWCTVANSGVQHAGVIRFERAETGTRLHVEMTYAPPAGVLGHMAAKVFGADPKTALEEDLVRLKTFLETGVPAQDAARRAEQAASPDSREIH
ncbi:MAG: SRPBCC family protein [Steroidobacteraceae bacterium]